MFRAYNLSLKVQNKVIVDIDMLHLKRGAFSALIGPNGAGKTTLLNLLAGDVTPTTGKITLDGKPLDDYTIGELAIMRSVLPQAEHIPFAIKSKAILLMGVMPYQVAYSHPKVLELLAEISRILELDDLLDANYQTLSGGEQHRVQIGRIIMQTLFSLDDDLDLRGKTMLLDEPFNHLDLYHQQQLLRYFKGLTQQGLTVICVMHDINHALQVADDLIILKNGVLQGNFTPETLMRTKILHEVFNVDFVTLHNLDDLNFSSFAFRV